MWRWDKSGIMYLAGAVMIAGLVAGVWLYYADVASDGVGLPSPEAETASSSEYKVVQ